MNYKEELFQDKLNSIKEELKSEIEIRKQIWINVLGEADNQDRKEGVEAIITVLDELKDKVIDEVFK